MQLKKRPIIAIDVDDVIGSENEAIRQFINLNYGSNHTKEDYLVDGKYWGYWESIWNVSKDEAEQRFNTFLNSSQKDNLEIIDGAVTAIERLKENYDLVIVTSRFGRQLKTTKPWLDKHFPKTFKQIAFVGTWSKDKEVAKARICKEIGADFLIDDNAEHCNLAAKEGVKCLLFGDYGWNRNVKLHKNVLRVSNWNEVLHVLK